MRMRLPAVFQRLAFVAILALACVPTLGRLAQGAPRTAQQAAPPTAAASTHHGHHAHADHAPGRAVAPAPATPPHHGTSGDCDYCPLLQGLLTPCAVPAASSAAAAPVARLAPVRDARFHAPYPAGLGSRGPPIA